MKSSKYNILKWLRSLVKRIMPNTANDTSYEDIDTAIANWQDIYADNPPWLKKCHYKTLNLGAGIASEFARLMMVEFKSEITGSKRADYINKQYHNLTEMLRTKLESACAVGGIVFKPYVQNGAIMVDCITQDRFIPVSYTSQGITGAVFVSQETRNGKFYTRLEKQIYDNQKRTHTIESHFFVSNNRERLGTEISDDNYGGNIEPYIQFNDVDRPLFAFWRVPFANQINPDSPLGVSVFSRAVNLLEEVDLQWDRYLWEYRGGTLAVHASEALLRQRTVTAENGISYNAKELPESRDRLFQTFSVGDPQDPMYKVFSPTLRDEQYANGVDKIIRKIEFACSLAYGTISDPQNVDKTAEEIRSSKQRSYATVCDMQQSLQTALEDYIYALNEYTTACNLAPIGDYEVQFNWGDGVLEDSDKEQAIRLQEVNSGIITKENYLEWRYGVTEKQAKEMIPKADVTDLFGGR